MIIRTAVAAAVLALAGVTQAIAQANYPNKPVRWIIPYAPGGGTDVIARPIALKLSEVLGQQILYENRGGGNGLIAAEFVARQPADGYTLLVPAGNTHVFSTLLYGKISFDPVKDFAMITNFASIPNVLVSHPSFPPKSIAEIVAYGKANPGKINWASSGNGAGGHLGLIVFADLAGIKVTHVPFKGAGPATTAMLGGETDLLLANTGVFFSHIKSGKLRVLGVAANKRLSVMPDVPTFTEMGYPVESASFYGLAAPAGTPRAIINKLHGELVKIINSPESVKRLEGDGAFPVANTPEQFAEYLRVETAKWGKIIRDNGIKAD